MSFMDNDAVRNVISDMLTTLTAPQANSDLIAADDNTSDQLLQQLSLAQAEDVTKLTDDEIDQKVSQHLMQQLVECPDMLSSKLLEIRAYIERYMTVQQATRRVPLLLLKIVHELEESGNDDALEMQANCVLVEEMFQDPGRSTPFHAIYTPEENEMLNADVHS